MLKARQAYFIGEQDLQDMSYLSLSLSCFYLKHQSPFDLLFHLTTLL